MQDAAAAKIANEEAIDAELLRLSEKLEKVEATIATTYDAEEAAEALDDLLSVCEAANALETRKAELDTASKLSEELRTKALKLQAELLREQAEHACQTTLSKAAMLHQKAERAKRMAAKAAADAAEAAERAAREAAEEAQRKADAVPLESSSDLTAKITDVKGSLQQAVDSLSAKKDSLGQKVAEVLVRKKSNPKDLVAEWDRKHKGEISKVEFRQGVRGLGLKADNKDIDTLFDTIDTDGGGSLDLPELKDALKEMQEKELEAMAEESRVTSLRERLKQKLDMLEQTLTAFIEAEGALQASGMQASLPLKRVALKLQAKLTTAEAEWEAKEKKEAEAREREAQEKADAHERELAKAAEKARLKAEKEAKEKAEREKRLQEKDAKTTSSSLAA